MENERKNQHDVRREQQFRRLRTRNPKCHICGETDAAALTSTDGDIICYECQAEARGKSPVEKHHYAGQHNDSFRIPVPGNDHRVLSDNQRDWPNETLRNPNGSPLLKAAASLRGWLDILRLLIERILGWIPEYLEQLDAYLTTINGQRWWVNPDPKGEIG